MPKITTELVRKIAKLGGLQLNDETVARFQSQFEGILAHFESLNAVDVNSVEPLYHAIDENHFRPDEGEPESIQRKVLLKNAPDHDEIHYRLGRILGGAE